MEIPNQAITADVTLKCCCCNTPDFWKDQDVGRVAPDAVDAVTAVDLVLSLHCWTVNPVSLSGLRPKNPSNCIFM